MEDDDGQQLYTAFHNGLVVAKYALLYLQELRRPGGVSSHEIDWIGQVCCSSGNQKVLCGVINIEIRIFPQPMNPHSWLWIVAGAALPSTNLGFAEYSSSSVDVEPVLLESCMRDQE